LQGGWLEPSQLILPHAAAAVETPQNRLKVRSGATPW
jgi:hypothetical protein